MGRTTNHETREHKRAVARRIKALGSRPTDAPEIPGVPTAVYTRIEAFAEAVGDKETAQLAKRIRREEERMAKYLTAELPRLVRDLVRAEVPRDQRATPTRARRAPARRGATSSRKTRRTTTASGRR